MMRHQYARHIRIGPREGLADELHLVVADPPVLEGQRTGRVDPEHGDAGHLDEWAQSLVDEAAIAGERRKETAEHIVERHVVIAGNADHFVAALAEPLEELAGFLELLGPRALGEVPADYDEVGFQLP